MPNKLYRLSSPATWPPDVIYGNINYVEHEVVQCAFCSRKWLGDQLSDLEIELYGSKLKDFVWTDSPALIITERLLTLLSESNLSGFESRTVHVVNSEQYPEVETLCQLVVTETAGHAADQTGVVKLDECQHCGWVRYAPPTSKTIYVDPTRWDGSDIFTVAEFPSYPLISEGFLNVLKTNGVENYQVETAAWSE